MKPRSLILLLLLGLIVAAGAWYFADSGPGEEIRALGAAAVGEHPEAPDPRHPAGRSGAASTLEGGAREVARETLSPAEVADAADRDSRLIASGRWVDVSVELPPGTPASEELELLLVAPTERGGDGALRWLLDDDSPVMLDPGSVRRTVVEDPGSWFHAAAPIAEDEVVRMPYPGETDTAWLILCARFLYQDAPESVGADRIGGRVRLRPVLGARVQGRLRRPGGASPTVAVSDRGPGTVDLQALGTLREGGRMGFLNREVRVEDLAFEFNGLPAGVDCRLTPEVPGWLGVNQRLSALGPGEEHVVELELRIGGRLRGRVLSRDGEPIAGAEVNFHGDAGRRFGVRSDSVRSGTDGAFELSGAPAGDVRLFASAEGWRRPEPQSFDMAEGGLIEGIEFRLESGSRVAGRVLWPDGAGAAASVSLHGTEQRGEWRLRELEQVRECDEQGRFEFAGLDAPGPFRLEASARARAAPGEPDVPEHVRAVWIAERDAVAADTSEIELRLAPSLGIAGRVVDDRGEPIDAFALSASRAQEPMESSELSDSFEPSPGRPVERSFEAAAGVFFLDGLGPGSWQLSAEAEGHHAPEGPRASATVVLPGDGSSVELVLSRSAALGGRVLDPLGRPVAGASVHESSAEGGAFGWRTGFGDDESARATTDARGAFTIEGLAPGSAAFEARADAWASSEPTPVELAPGARLEDLVLALREGGRIVGEAFDEAGDPLAGRSVSLGENAFMMGFGGGASEVTDAAGGFVFDHVDPGKWSVTLAPQQRSMSLMMEDDADQQAFLDLMSQFVTRSVTVGDGEEVYVRLGAEPKRPVRVHGRVLAAGAPLEQGTVVAISEGNALMQGMKMAQVGGGGRYELVLDRPGAYVIGVQGTQADGIEFPIDVPEVEVLEQDLVLPMGAISGTVFGPDGRPANAVNVSLGRDGAGLSLSMDFGGGDDTDADGRFAFEHLRPGRYELRAGGQRRFFDSSEDPLGVVIVSEVRVEADRRVEGLEIHLEPSGRITGVVRDERGSPVGGVSVFVRDEQGRPLSRLSSTITSAAGQFTYRGVAPGRVSVSARGRQLASADSAVVQVRAGEASPVELRVVPATDLLVTVEDGGGQPVRASIRVLDEAGLEVGGLRLASDIEAAMSEGVDTRQTRVGPLPPGSYTVIATGVDGRSEEKPVKLSGKPERALRIRLRD